MAGGFRKFLDSLSDGVGRDLPLFEDNGDGEPVVRHREPNSDELALGWIMNEDEKTGRPVIEFVGVPQEHRSTHFYVVGASGTGKTKFLETLAVQDATHGYGFGVVDAGSDLTEHLKGYLYLGHRNDPDYLRERIVLIDPSDPDYTVCFNPLERADGMDTDDVVEELVEVFKKIWADAWGQRMEDLMKNTLIVLVEHELTIAELPLFLSDSGFRKRLLSGLKRYPFCLEYWERFNGLPPRTRDEWSESTLNKVRAFLNNNKVRQIFVARKSTFSFRDIMDDQKILLVKLDRGRFKGSADLLGSLLLAKIQMAAFARHGIEEERVPFYLYVDEFQHFATENFLETLAESRKYKMPLILAHQNLAQLPPTLRASILGNCGLQAYFRISRADADILAKESLAPVYQNPPGWESYIQLLQGLMPTWYIAKNNIAQAVVKLKTRDIEPPHVMAKMDAAAFASAVAAAQIGGAYLRPRAEVEAEYTGRRKELLQGTDAESFRERETGKAVNYEEMIKGGENDGVEFKESLRYGYENGKISKEMEHMVAKAVSAFMNAEGGTLFIGVQDDGEVLGLEKDYATFPHKNKDEFLLQLTQVINKYIGKEFHQYANVKIVPIRGKDICIVSASKSNKPVYLKNGDVREFYIRASASSQPMNIEESHGYIEAHFSKIERF